MDTAAVTHADVPIYLTGLGTVQAFYTVTVTARVDGELQNVAFTEGQTVQQGRSAGADRSAPESGGARSGASRPRRRMRRSWRTPSAIWTRYTLLQPQDLASKQTVDTQRAMVEQLAAQLQGRSGRHRQCAHAARLHAHHLAHQRPHRHPPGRSGQHRARGGHHGHRGGHAGAAHLGHFHPAGGGLGRGRRRACRGPGASHHPVARRPAPSSTRAPCR